MIFSDDASGFVNIGEAIPDIILEIRYYTTFNFVGERIDGYEQPVALLTREAAEALRAVSDDVMRKGFRLKVYDAYRPQKAVDHFLRWAKDAEDTRMKAFFYPEVEKDRIIPEGYLAEHSGHTRGSTVDLTLLDMRTGRDADPGGPFDFVDRLSHPDYPDLTPEQHRIRGILREAMMRHSFQPIPTEWWHYTLDPEPYPDTYFTFPVRADFRG